MKYTPISSSLFKKNRHKLSEKLCSGSMAVISSAISMPRNGDQHFPFRQNSDLFYLSGIEQENSLLVLFPKHPTLEMREILFLTQPNKSVETWQGVKLSKEKAIQLSGINTIYWLSEFDVVMEQLLPLCVTIFNNDVLFPKLDSCFLYDEIHIKQLYKSHKQESLMPLLTECRLIKEAEEVALLEKACSITEEAFFKTINHIKPGIKEYEIEALITYHFLRQGASGHSFPPIVASGKNALTLHYESNDDVCKNGDLLLLDFGCEYANYASDCSRTIPINGHFSKRQKECYNAILFVFEKAKELFIPNNCIAEVNKEVNKLMEEQMIKLGLFSQNDIELQLADAPLFRSYYMHGVSHFVGLDAHDIGNANILFKPGMVVSCEPGIYIKEENIGIRIETMLLITESRPIDLMPNLPKTVEEIESFFNL